MQGGDPAALGSLCSVACTAQKCYQVPRGNLLCSSLCPLPFVLALGTTDNSGPILSGLSSQVFMDIDEIPQSLLFSS